MSTVVLLVLYALLSVTQSLLKCTERNRENELGGGAWRIGHMQCYGDCVDVDDVRIARVRTWPMTAANRAASCGTNRDPIVEQSGSGCKPLLSHKKRLRSKCTPILRPIPYGNPNSGSMAQQRRDASCDNEPCDQIGAPYLSYAGATGILALTSNPEFCKMPNNADEQDVSNVEACPPGTQEVERRGCIHDDTTKRTQTRICEVRGIVDSVGWDDATSKWKVVYNAGGYTATFGGNPAATYQYTEYDRDGTNPQQTAHQSYNNMLLSGYDDLENNIKRDEEELKELNDELHEDIKSLRQKKKHRYRHQRKKRF